MQEWSMLMNAVSFALSLFPFFCLLPFIRHNFATSDGANMFASAQFATTKSKMVEPPHPRAATWPARATQLRRVVGIYGWICMNILRY